MASFIERWRYGTVSALAYSAAQGWPSGFAADLEPPYNDVARFLLNQQARMPDYLRQAMGCATLGFDLAGFPGAWQFFHCQSAVSRRQKISNWKNSKRSFQRDLIRYYESLTTLALFSRDASACAGEAVKNAGMDVHREGVLAMLQTDSRWEIVVVGSGPGGSITACLLAEAGKSVLLIEEGPFHSIDSCESFSIEEMQQKYRNGGQTVAMGSAKIAYVEGRCVGGGSEINSGLYHRTPPEVLERWRKEFGVEALTEPDVIPHFEACERDLSVGLSAEPPPGAATKLERGAHKLGWKCFEVPRWFKQGTSGGRQSMSVTYIPRFLLAGGQLAPNTRVQRIRQEGGTWLLEARHSAGAVRICAETVFLCAGAVQSPALLRRSGIGNNIGDSLKLHPTVKLTAAFQETINTPGMGVPSHQVKEFSPRLSFGCSISSRPYLALALLEQAERESLTLEGAGKMANYYAMITGEGRGSVRSAPGFRDPLVRYQLTAQDRRDLADGLRKLAELFFEAGAIRIFPGVPGVQPLSSRDDLRRLPEGLPESVSGLMTIHLFSSCPMGEERTRCATDSFGKLHGHKGLFVSDASLLCGAPGVNPQGTIMALARRNALRFLGKA